MWPLMPVKTILEAIFGATVVFHLEGLCRAEALMVKLPGHLTQPSVQSFQLLTVCLCVFKYQAQIQSQVDTCHHFTRKTLALPVTEDIRVLHWNQQQQVRMNLRALGFL